MLLRRWPTIAFSLCPLLAVLCVPGPARAQSAPATGAAIGAPSPTGGASPTVTLPLPSQVPPDMTTLKSEANPFEHGTSVTSLPAVIVHQWSPAEEIPPESFISERYLRTRDTTVARLTLKQAIYTALRNNPNVKAAELNPVAATEGVRAQNAIFDLDLTGSLQDQYSRTPITTPLETFSGHALVIQNYVWNFAAIKILASTNGTLGLTFSNTNAHTNNLTQTVEPSFQPNLALSLSQPLLRNFGWEFATINVRLAESTQKQAQWQYAQTLNDFIQRVGNEYWGVIQADENLKVALESLKFNRDLVRVNRVGVQVGTLAPIALQEALSSEASAEANVYSAEAALKTARAILRQDVMLNPRGAFVPEEIEPAEQPNPSQVASEDLPSLFKTAVEYRPSLADMREAIRAALLQVKFQENQLLPQVNVQAQFGLNQLKGTAKCGPLFGLPPSESNCTQSGGAPGFALTAFNGGYADSLNSLFNFAFYNYAGILTYERPLENASARAALAQQRAAYEQLRMTYRAALSQVVVELENAVANFNAFIQSVRATQAATRYARESLHDEQETFKVGMATTHDLLQYESELTSAEGNQVQAEVGLENARLALRHADGTLLDTFGIRFQIQNPRETPWFARF